MIRISDILRQGSKSDEKPIVKRSPLKGKEKVSLDVEREIKKRPVRVVKEVCNSEDIYNDGILLIKNIMDNYQQGDIFDITNVAKLVNKIVDKVCAREDDICVLSLESTAQNYMYAHSLNVCILSLKLGLALKLDKKELATLGLSAFLHDIGMVKYSDIVNQPVKLSDEELTPAKAHSYETADYLRQIIDLEPETLSKVCEIVAQTHERLNGRGYPRGLLFEEIHTSAQIIGLIDSYEAMTHYRVYREKVQPPQAIEELLRLRKIFFEPQLVKVLVEVISLYPLGSCIRINTEEIARVIRVNEGHPTRPVIEVYIDQRGKKLREKKVIDLTKAPMIWIKETITEDFCEGQEK